MARSPGVATPDVGMPTESSVSAVAWSAVLAGAFVSGAVSLLLVIFGTGLGLSSVSAWSGLGASATTFTVGAAIWLIVVQWLSSGLGGYVTGRMRTKWASMGADEVFFRDTAHGLLAWAVATVVTVGLLASGASSVIGSAGRGIGNVAASAVGGASQGAAQGSTQSGGGPDLSGYYVDTLFRSDKAAGNDQDSRAEAGRILVRGARDGSMSDSDKAYLGRIVAARTGLSQDDATKRVNDVLGQIQAAETKAREAADQARKATAQASFFLFFSMLIGAFIASAAAALGGRQRDEI